MLFRDKENVTKSESVTNLVRNRLEKWSNSIDQAKFKGFSNDVLIKDITCYPLTHCVVDTLLELRRIELNSKSYSIYTHVGECTHHSPGEIDPWELTMESPPKDFISQTHHYTIPSSSRVETCRECTGRGTLGCSQCGSTGKVGCSSCGGSGSVNCSRCGGRGSESCHSCGGSGYHEEQRVNEWTDSDGTFHREIYYDKVSCSACGGYGEIDCDSCNGGQVTCGGCGGCGETECSACGGYGYQKCYACDGEGKVILSLVARQDYNNDREVHRLVYPELMVSYRDYTFQSNDVFRSMQSIYEEVFETGIPENCYSSFIPEYFMKQYQFEDGIKKFIKAQRSKAESRRLVGQKLMVVQSDLYYVKYQYKGVDYELLIDEAQDRVFSRNSPFTDFADKLLADAEKETNSKHYGLAYNYAKEALEFYKGSQKEKEIAALMKKITTSMKYHYKLGAFWGFVGFFLYKFIPIAEFLYGNRYPIENYMRVIFRNGVVPAVLAVFIWKLLHYKLYDRFFINDRFRLIIGAIIGLILYYVSQKVTGSVFGF